MSMAFNLPKAFCEEGDASAERAVAMVAMARIHLSVLERQAAYFKLRGALRGRFSSARSFVATMGSHWNEDGEMAHVNLDVEFLDGEGRICRAESDPDSGYLPVEAEHLDDLRYVLNDMPADAFRAICRERVECLDDRSLAMAVMGEQGFAEFEAEERARAAKAAGVAKGV